MEIIIPPPLQIGDSIGVVAPSSHFDPEKFESGIKTIEEFGYKIKIPREIFIKDSYLAGSDKQRAQTLNDLFYDPEIKCIVCARGGSGSMKILSKINYQNIRNNPKIFIGFSDITSLLVTISRRCGMITYHGPVITGLSEKGSLTIESLKNIISGKINNKILFNNSNIVKKGKSSGQLIGGNLTTICHMMGTKFEPDFENSILIIEDINEPLYKIDRMLTQLQLCDCFKKIKGMIIGSFSNCGDINDIYNIIIEHLRNAHIPVVAGFDFGHGENNISIPIGMDVLIDTFSNVLMFNN